MTRPNSFKLIFAGKARRALLHLVLVSVGAAVVLAQQSPALKDAPSADRLRAHITYLASGKLEGRRTGTAGANLAAEYIAGEFARYGLRLSNGYDTAGMSKRKADSHRRYLQEFPYVAAVELGNKNLFWVRLSTNDAPLNFDAGEEWTPLGFSANARIDNSQVVFAGYGITAAELKYDDYADGRARGKVSVAFAGTPDGDNPHGQFARYEDVRWKAIAAKNAGAKSLIVIAHEENFREDRLTRFHYDNSAGDAGLPVIVISRQAAVRLLGLNGMASLAKFEGDAGRLSLEQGTREIRGYNVTLTVKFDFLSNATLSIATNVVRRAVSATNVIGILPGSDPKLKNEAIVLGAHYDHLGHGGAGSLAPREGEIHHGADDNASGVAGMLELARIFSAQQPRPKRTIVFIAFSGEEEGLLGSNYYVNHPVVPLTNTVAMINMDMIGRMKNNNLIVGGVGSAPEWRSLIESENQMQSLTINASAPAGDPGNISTRTVAGAPLVVSANGRTIVSSDPGKNLTLTLNEDGFGPSDHSSFYSKQVPVLFFWTGTHDDYHKPSDTADKINYEGEARIISYVARLVRNIDKNEKRPTYAVAKTESTGRSMGFRVYLGTIPNYADSTSGLLLDGVRDDSPAAMAGLKAGDRIVKLAGREVKNVYDYTYSLGEMKAGQEYEVEVMRGSERLSLRITPAARK